MGRDLERLDKESVRVTGWKASADISDLDANFAILRNVLLAIFVAGIKDGKQARHTTSLADLLKKLSLHAEIGVENLEKQLDILRRLHLLTITDEPKLMDKAYQIAILPNVTMALIEQNYPQLAGHYVRQNRRAHIMLQYCAAASSEERRVLVHDYFTSSAEVFDALHPELPDMQQPLTEIDHEALIKPLNAVQHDIVVATDPELMVLAGPGSGKTRTLVHRIAYLIKARRVAPQHIVALAFNRNAADEIRQRLHRLIGADAFGVQISTFHSLALRLLGKTIGDDKQEQDWVHVIEHACELFAPTEGASNAALYAQRLQILGDIEYVFVDEYQDIDQYMYQLLHLLTGKDLPLDVLAPRVNICVVGDDDQGIYGFRDADTKYLQAFEDDYNARRIPLTDNYQIDISISFRLPIRTSVTMMYV